LGRDAPTHKCVVLPNTPINCYKMFSVKHLIEIVPLSFPMGFPSDEEFDPWCCRINHKGEFYYHPKLKVDGDTMEPQNAMKILDKTIYTASYNHWWKPFSTPLGNGNYNRDSRKFKPEKWNRTADSTFKAKFKEDVQAFSKYIK